MALTYEPIATNTLGSAAASITFSSISSAYTDLRVTFVAQGSGGQRFVGFQFNSDTGTNYSYTNINGDGSAAASIRGTSTNQIPIGENTGSTTTQFSFYTIDIFSYADSTYKTALATNAADQNGSGEVGYEVGLWRNTAAITSIRLFSVGGGNFAIGTTATLYGILKA